MAGSVEPGAPAGQRALLTVCWVLVLDGTGVLRGATCTTSATRVLRRRAPEPPHTSTSRTKGWGSARSLGRYTRVFPSSRKRPSSLPGREGLLSVTRRRGLVCAVVWPLLTSNNGVSQHGAVGAAVAQQAGDRLAAARGPSRDLQLLHLGDAHRQLVRHSLPGARGSGREPAVLAPTPAHPVGCPHTCRCTDTSHRLLCLSLGSRSL